MNEIYIREASTVPVSQGALQLKFLISLQISETFWT
jgi:hypothetical protein